MSSGLPFPDVEQEWDKFFSTDPRKPIQKIMEKTKADKRKMEDINLLISRNRNWLKDAHVALCESIDGDVRLRQACVEFSHAFTSSEHVLRCTRSYEFVQELGGMEKIKQLKQRYAEFKERKLEPDELDYDTLLSSLFIFDGSIVALKSQRGGYIRIARTTTQASDATNPSDITFQTRTGEPERNITLSFDTAKARIEPINAKNVVEIFDKITDDANITRAFKSDIGKDQTRKGRWCLSLYTDVFVKQARDFIEKTPGLAGIIDKRPTSETDATAEDDMGDDDDVQVVSVSTREDRDRIGRLNAISLE